MAAVQVESYPGDHEANLRRAEREVERAVALGAELVLCAELLRAGFVFDSRLWAAAEAQGGATETWLCRLARAHGLYIGASYVEVSGSDVFNTFALAEPGGSILGRVRKESLPGFEAWFFASSLLPGRERAHARQPARDCAVLRARSPYRW